ncbi:MAG: hypothetical protein ACI841_000938 [Planctomycetota bacterium]|jgi:hypothetical protein
MKFARSTTIALALCSFSTSAQAWTPALSAAFVGGGDTCAVPDPIAGAGNFSYDTTAATTGVEGQNETNCYKFGSSAIDSDVWFDWTSDFTGTVLMTMCNGGGGDTKIAAYPSGGCPLDGTSLDCNDDTCGLLSEITFAVTSGTSYMLQIGTFPGGATSAGTFDISAPGAPPANDNCASPTIIAGQGSYNYNTNAATTGVEGQNESLCYKFGSSVVDSDTWFSWTADATGMAVVTTCNLGTGDPKLAAWPNVACPADGTSLACNDDTCGLLPEISFSVVDGSTYTLQMGTFPGATTSAGGFEITIAPPPTLGNNYCTSEANSVAAAGSTISGSGTSSIAAQDITLSADNAPDQPAIFYYGPNQLSIVFGNGTRCVGGLTVMFPPVLGAGGSFDYTIDFSLPQVQFSLGSTNFQCWYRDPAGGGAAFNFSDGYEIIMTP